MTAYAIFIRERLRNEAEMALYLAKVAGTAAAHDGRMLARSENVVTLEGAGAEAVILIAFPGIDAARAWYDSEAYRAAKPHRHLAADFRVLLIESP